MEDRPKPITCELRDVAARCTAIMRTLGADVEDDVVTIHKDEFGGLCDAIDAVDANLAAERDELRDECNWLHSELHGWEAEAVKLPLDADGVPIRVGDVLDYDYGDGIAGTCTVDALILTDRWDYELSDEDGDTRNVVSMDDFYCCIHHHHPDSWERIIEDAINTHGNGFNPCWDKERDALVVRCRALAGEE